MKTTFLNVVFIPVLYIVVKTLVTRRERAPATVPVTVGK